MTKCQAKGQPCVHSGIFALFSFFLPYQSHKRKSMIPLMLLSVLDDEIIRGGVHFR